MKEALVIFLKNPILGKVKTRLAKSIGEEKALLVYQDLLERTQLVCKDLDQDLFLYYSDFIDEKDAWDNQRYHKRLQVKGDLGDRLKAACKEMSERGYEKMAIIGSDCYDLDVAIIQEAFMQLEAKDMVLGPANDGGYYLIAFNQWKPNLFEKISWSSELVLKETLEKAGELNWNVFMLPELIDLDTFEDLKKSGYPSQKLKEYAGKNKRNE